MEQIIQEINKIKDNDLIKLFKFNENEDALKELVHRHIPLCLNIVSKYASILSSSGSFPQDIIDEAPYLIYKSVLSYDDSRKTQFSTWLGNQVRFECLHLINDKVKELSFEKSDDLDKCIENQSIYLNEEIEPNSILNEDNINKLNNILDGLQNKTAKQIIKLRYFNLNKKNKKMTFREIGNLLQMSGQNVINIHDRVMKLIKYRMKKS